MEAGQAQGATMDTRGFRWRVRPPCASHRSPIGDAAPADIGRPVDPGRPSFGPRRPPAGLGSSGGMRWAPAEIGHPELRKRSRAPPLAGSGRCLRAERERSAGQPFRLGNDAGPAGQTPASPAVRPSSSRESTHEKARFDDLHYPLPRSMQGPHRRFYLQNCPDHRDMAGASGG
jgi:hypothetical protein